MKRVLFAAALMASPAAMAETPLTVTFTYDDLPVHGVLPSGMSRVEIAKQLIEGLKAGGVPPTVGLVNGVGVEREPASAPVLSLWRESGNLLGNHTWSHPGLSNTAAPAFEADTLKNEPLLIQYAGASQWHYFRYPFLDEGKDAAQRSGFRAFLAKHGYKIAHVTTALNDWDYPEPYARCLAKNDQASIAKLEDMYLTRAEQGLAYSRALSAAAYGRDIPYILLQHIGAFQVHILPKLVALYKSKGVGFIGLDEALKDPAYAAYANPALPNPPRSMVEAAAAKGASIPSGLDDRIAELQAMCR